MTGATDDMDGIGSATMGNAAVSDVVFGDAGTGLTLAPSGTSESEGKDRSKKGTGNNLNTGSAGSKTVVRSRANARYNALVQHIQNIGRKAFRQGWKEMFFNHVSPRNRPTTKIAAAPTRRPSR